jgi:hypothetical protein
MAELDWFVDLNRFEPFLVARQEGITMKRTMLITLWTLVFLLIPGFVLGGVVGVSCIVSPSRGQHILDGLGTVSYVFLAVSPIAAGLVGLLLGIFGKLPGTKSRLSQAR